MKNKIVALIFVLLIVTGIGYSGCRLYQIGYARALSESYSRGYDQGLIDGENTRDQEAIKRETARYWDGYWDGEREGWRLSKMLYEPREASQ